MPHEPIPSDPDQVTIIPLGGVEEFGLNMTLYGHRGRWLMVDCGAGFPDEQQPGLELLMPNPRFILERRDALEAIIITHAHEDHVGALGHLWPKLSAPVYATPFAMAVAEHKLKEAGVSPSAVPRHLFRAGDTLEIGPFRIATIPMAHSIPETVALAITTGAGTVLHTADWKIDHDPVVGHRTDEAALQALGRERVLAVVSDSTNAQVPGHSESERQVEHGLKALFAELKHRIVVTCFSSNIARLRTVAVAAADAGRHCAILGRSMKRMVDIARSQGYLDGIPDFIDISQIGYLPRERTVIVCTGSQGEPRSALARIAAGDSDDVVLEEGDAIVFSSRAIPGNEREIMRMRRQLVAQGLELITDRDARVHVSGHATQGDITQLYQWLKPQVVIPVHGEPDHLLANARLAESCQVPRTVLPVNGSVLTLGRDGRVREIDTLEVELMALDGARLAPLDEGTLAARRRLALDGFAAISLAIDRTGALAAAPRISLRGVASQAEEVEVGRKVAQELEHELRAGGGRRGRRDGLEDVARAVTRRIVRQVLGKRPMIDVALLQVD